MTTYQIAIETIGKTGSLAILKDETVVSAERLPADQRTAAILAVSLDKLLSKCRSEKIELDWISVAAGPGSFTGIRIGMTTAKMLGYALNRPILPVGSLSALALGIEPVADDTIIAVGINAFRGQVFAADFAADELAGADPVDWEPRASVLDKEVWLEKLGATQAAGPVAVVGDSALVPPQLATLFRDRGDVDAVGVGRVAYRLWQAAGADCLKDPFEALPRYLRPSAAEEKAGVNESTPGPAELHRSRNRSSSA